MSSAATMDIVPKKANFPFMNILIIAIIVAMIVAGVFWVRKHPQIIPGPGPVISS